MSDTAFAELTKTATSLEYARRVELLNLLAQSLYDDIPSREEAGSGSDEAVRDMERGVAQAHMSAMWEELKDDAW